MHKTAHNQNRQELVFFDETNPRAIISLVPDALAQRIRALKSSPEDAFLLGLSENRLLGELIRRSKKPTSTDNRLRLQFWLEYDRVQTEHLNHPKFSMSYVIGFAMGKEPFYSYYIQDNCALAWMLCPPVSYKQMLEDTLRESNQKLMELMNFPLVKPNGEVDKKLAEFIFKVNTEFHRRINGGAFYRGDKKSGEGELEGELEVEPVEKVAPDLREISPEEKLKRLEELAAKTKQLPGGE